MASTDLHSLAAQIHAYEQEGLALSHGWYEFEDADSGDVQKLQHLSAHALSVLDDLSQRLDAALKSRRPASAERQQLEHAYNLVQELIQSRSAIGELLAVILRKDRDYKEYFRAVAIKEKAAQSQAQTLTTVLAQLQ